MCPDVCSACAEAEEAGRWGSAAERPAYTPIEWAWRITCLATGCPIVPMPMKPMFISDVQNIASEDRILLQQERRDLEKG